MFMNGRVSGMIAVPGIPTYGSCYAQTGGDFLSERTIGKSVCRKNRVITG